MTKPAPLVDLARLEEIRREHAHASTVSRTSWSRRMHDAHRDRAFLLAAVTRLAEAVKTDIHARQALERVLRELMDAQDAMDQARPNFTGEQLGTLRAKFTNARTLLSTLAAHPAPLARAGEPTPTDLVRELRDAAGLPNGARPDPPKVVWEETLAYVRSLRDALYLYEPVAAPPAGPGGEGRELGDLLDELSQTAEGAASAYEHGALGEAKERDKYVRELKADILRMFQRAAGDGA